jgi:hypothetical protein
VAYANGPNNICVAEATHATPNGTTFGNLPTDHSSDTTLPSLSQGTTQYQLLDTIRFFSEITPGVGTLGFTEIDDSLFLPGNDLPASLMQTLNHNAKAAALTPEFFGPTIYGDGDTIQLPVSLIDGYVYSRSEITYLWEWADTTPNTGSNLRVPAFTVVIDQSSGLIQLNSWRLPPGDHAVLDHEDLNSISVIVMAQRSAQFPEVTMSAGNTPADLTSIIADQGQGDQINGV